MDVIIKRTKNVFKVHKQHRTNQQYNWCTQKLIDNTESNIR